MDEAAKEYIIERLCAENLHDLTTLYADVYGRKTTPDHFLKKYNTEYTGHLYIGYIAYDNNHEPLAYYGVLPCFIQDGEKIILAAQSANTMTSPRFRYKGLFVELSNKTFALCRESGILLIYGFPNQNSYHGAVNKLGWIMTDSLDYFAIPVKRNFLGSVLTASRIFGKLYDAYCHSVLNKYIIPGMGQASSVLKEGWAGVNRSKDYLEYKSYNPSYLIRLGDARVWIRNKAALCVGDMVGVSEKNFSQVIKGLKKLASKLGRKQVQFHCSPGIHLHHLFSSAFDPKPSFPALFQDFGSAIAPGKIMFTYADLDSF